MALLKTDTSTLKTNSRGLSQLVLDVSNILSPKVDAAQATFLDALSIALQHPAVAADQQNICRLLQVCRSWRLAVKYSDACLTDLFFDKSYPSGEGDSAAVAVGQAQYEFVVRFRAFAKWISSYSGTVRSINVRLRACDSSDTGKLERLARDVLASHLRFGCSPKATLPRALLSTASSYMGITGAAVVPKPLKLRSFTCCSNCASPEVVFALPIAPLTHLMVPATCRARLQEALCFLTSLQSLHLDTYFAGYSTNDYLSSIRSLRKLTDLRLFGAYSSNNFALLPQQLRKLDLTVSHAEQQHFSLALSHLNQLLELKLYGQQLQGGSLPTQLEALETNCRLATLNITSLQRLQQLMIDNSKDDPSDLLLLQLMTQLQTIQLSYRSKASFALAAAPTWSQLKPLVGLQFGTPFKGVNLKFKATEMIIITEAVSKLTGLTQLIVSGQLQDMQQLYNFDNNYYHGPEEEEALLSQIRALERFAGICHSLRNLRTLRDLRLSILTSMPQDAMWLHKGGISHLSYLTLLTCLRLRLEHVVLDDAMITAVLQELTGLQDLSLWKVKQNSSILPVVGRLRGLTRLCIDGLQAENHDLQHLGRLWNLCELYGPEKCSKQALRKFWGDLHGY